MNIQDILNQLLNARVSHLRWVARAEALVEGVPLDKNQVPLLATDCDFAHWYLGEGRVLRHLPSYDNVAIHHDRLHRIYWDIFTHLYGEKDRLNIFQWLGVKHTVNHSNQEKARLLIPQLKEASQEVLTSLEQLTSEFNQYLKPKKNQNNNPVDALDKLQHNLEKMGYGGKSSS
ncbi:MAG: CZB domain-containing protein [Mariprofundaceae bacterium]|nr:CZB domain-containing protein [Mariprofundaceae bacterium]